MGDGEVGGGENGTGELFAEEGGWEREVVDSDEMMLEGRRI